MQARADSNASTRRHASASSFHTAGHGAMDVRQFIASLLIVFLVLPTWSTPELIAGSHSEAQSVSGSPIVSQKPPATSRQLTTSGGAVISEAAFSLRTPTLNGGRIEGGLRICEGKNFSLGTKFAMTGDLFVPGTPTIELQQGASYGGVIDEGGTPEPSYKIQLQKDFKLPGKIHIRTDPVPMPGDIPASVPQPAGSRKVNVNKPDDLEAIGDWKTLRDLTVTANGLTIEVPPGNYGKFTVNGPALLRFAAGDYSFASGLDLHQQSVVEVAGAGSITLGTSFNCNGGKIRLVSGITPHQLRLNVLGSTLNLNGDTEIEALVRAPHAHANLNGQVIVRGQLIVDRLTLNGGTIIGNALPTETDTTPPTIEIISPVDSASVFTSSITVRGRASDGEGPVQTGVASITVNGLNADFDPSTGAWATEVPLT
ncbi:MAG TPA: hypothetical protein PLP42_12660, partial [Acidobacteriota bacterium]|nr:hypothetical protein [Acidobacteriota bacterium]